jgi:hypothetical protein
VSRTRTTSRRARTYLLRCRLIWNAGTRGRIGPQLRAFLACVTGYRMTFPARTKALTDELRIVFVVSTYCTVVSRRTTHVRQPQSSAWIPYVFIDLRSKSEEQGGTQSSSSRIRHHQQQCCLLLWSQKSLLTALWQCWKANLSESRTNTDILHRFIHSFLLESSQWII